MATIRNRGNRWQAQIRRFGHKPISKSFLNKTDALRWARAVESELERGLYVNRSIAERTTIAALLDRYGEVVLPRHRGGQNERSRIKTLKAHLGHYTAATLSSMALAEFRDVRLKTVTPASVRWELGLMRQALKVAHNEWGILLPNGIPSVQYPKIPVAGRDRRLIGDEEQRLLASLKDNPLIHAVVSFALETGMRRGELSAMRWQHINLTKRLLEIPVTKTGKPRTIPLSRKAVSILTAIPRRIDGSVFGLRPDSITQAFARACERAKIVGLRFHDLRHEAVSRLFESGLHMMEVSAISGHEDVRMLMRYTHLKPEGLLGKEFFN